jgi:hypothetical protein
MTVETCLAFLIALYAIDITIRAVRIFRAGR